MSSTPAAPVTRRRVFYVPGYDPIPPRRYRELYRAEGAAQSEISGYALQLCAKPTPQGPYGWHVSAQIDGSEIETRIEVLVWSDIVQMSMESSILSTYFHMFKTAWIYISTGALGRLMRLRKGPVIAALYPVAMLVLQALLATGLALASYHVIVWGLGLISVSGIAGFPRLHQIAAGGVGLAIFSRCLRWFKSLDGQFFAYYLMHDYSYAAKTRGAYGPELEHRLAGFVAEVRAALQDDVDEVLIVGHSSGAHLSVSIVADVIRAGGVAEDGPALGLLTLGQVVPMVSFLPDANRLREDLHVLSVSDALAWVDVSAPGDGCAFALCDPVAVSGVARTGKRWPLVFSAAFSKSLSPARWKALRWRFFRLHFQYLCAFDRPRDYDYFQITAGPRTLADRYAGRPPSKSRLETPVNAYVGQLR